MAFDSLSFAAATCDLQAIVGSKITKIYQRDRFTVVLKLYGAGDNRELLLCAHPVQGRFQLTQLAGTNPTQPPVFCMMLRKHLEGAKITAIRQTDWDRVLHIDLDMIDETGLPAHRRLILEIMGKHSNLILVNPENNYIYDGIKRYSHAVSRYREILPGRTYQAPPQQAEKISIGCVTEEELAERLAASDYTVEVATALTRTLSGLSPFMAQELCAAANISAKQTCDLLGVYDYNRLWQAICHLRACREQGTFAPCVLQVEDKPYDFAALPVLHVPQEEQISFPTISEALDYYMKLAVTNNSFDTMLRDLQKLVQTDLSRLNKKITLQQEDFDHAQNADKYRIYGELLTTYLYLVEKGMTEITVDSLYEPDTAVTIPLQADLAPKDNIKRYFNRYSKAKKAKALIEEQLAASLQEREYLDSVALGLEQATQQEDLLEIKEELTDSGYLKQKFVKKGGKKSAAPLVEQPPYQYKSSDGFLIWAGRNNKQNDLLTLRKADRADIWLHTQKIPGSHVIIRRQHGRAVPDRTLTEAAQIAAWHSKARGSAQVPVDYTAVSQVKKPAAAKAGMVIYFQQKTLYVTPKLPEKRE